MSAHRRLPEVETTTSGAYAVGMSVGRAASGASPISKRRRYVHTKLHWSRCRLLRSYASLQSASETALVIPHRKNSHINVVYCISVIMRAALHASNILLSLPTGLYSAIGSGHVCPDGLDMSVVYMTLPRSDSISNFTITGWNISFWLKLKVKLDKKTQPHHRG